MITQKTTASRLEERTERVGDLIRKEPLRLLKANGHDVITCPVYLGAGCLGPTYNKGFKKYLCCGNHNQCPTANPEVCKHENFAEFGYRARNYPAQKKQL